MASQKQKQKQKRKVEWIEGWDESKFLLLDPLEWAGFHFVVVDGQISKFPSDTTYQHPAGPTQSFQVVLHRDSFFRLTLRPDICPEFSLDGIFTVTHEPQAFSQKTERGIIVAKSASGSPLPIQLLLQGNENIFYNPSESKRQYPVKAVVPIAGTSSPVTATSDPVAKSVVWTEIGDLKAHRGDPSRLKPDELVEQTFRSEFPNGFELLAQGDDKVIVFESLAALLGPVNPFTSQEHFDTCWWEEIINYDQLAFALLSDSDDQRTFVRKCQYIVGCAAAKLGHDIMLGVCYDDGTKTLLGQPRLQTHVPWVHIKLPADKKSFRLIWSRMNSKSNKTVMPRIV